MPIMGIHWQELVIILIIALVIFGPRRLPEIGRSLGSSLREFKESFADARKEIDEVTSIATLEKSPVKVLADGAATQPDTSATPKSSL